VRFNVQVKVRIAEDMIISGYWRSSKNGVTLGGAFPKINVNY
jgi:hypothetical protein